MATYTVLDTTMTALGDAVRSKVIGDIELYYNSGWITRIHSDSKDMKSFFHTMDGVSKIKLTINIEGVYNNKFPTIYYGKVKPLSTLNMIELKKNETTFPYEIILDGDKVSLYILTNPFTNPAIFCYEIVGLDENGNEFKYTPAEMIEKIDGLITIPDEALNITGDCSYKFSSGGWDWFISQCGDKIITNNITNTLQMFYYTDLKTIPFDINIASNISTITNTFNYADKLEVVPYIIGPEKKPPTSSYSGTLNMSYLFANCQRLRYIPEDYFWKIVPNKDFWETQANIGSQGQDNLFSYCYSLRKLPDISMIGGNWTSGYSCIYYYLLVFCYSLDEATNIPVYGTFSSNAMSNLFYNNNRLKDFTFAVNEDGTPKTANWKNQTIDFTAKGSVGYGSYTGSSFNSGITADKEVKDDATYQALKDDPDWYSLDVNYSRYNHDSAVNTINSLPDTSAYLATNGGTNTITFKGAAGALTDGGAINTLTEEEIAVATSRGWTVSLV